MELMSAPAYLTREYERWNAEVSRTAAQVTDAEANLRRVGWDLHAPAQVVHFWRTELGKRRKAWGYAKHRLSRIIVQLEAQDKYVP